MKRKYEDTPTILGYSEGPVGVLAGGGVFGFGGVVIHEPTSTNERVGKICTDPELETDLPRGIFLKYPEVATVTVSGLLRWTNSYLDRAPKGRQDVRETGPVRIEIFDEEGARQYIHSQSTMLGELGIKFIG